MRLPARTITRPAVRASALTTALALAVATLAAPTASADAAGPGRPAKPATPAPAVTTYAVPTPGAGLGRIATAPNGNLWFVEGTAHKVGRVVPRTGQIGETAVPSANPAPQLVDLDLAPDGAVWVVYDSGHLMLAADNTGASIRPTGGGYGFTDTVATSVRVAPNGVVWNTLLYPATGQRSVARTFASGPPETPADAAPACDGALGAGADGAMWCRSGDAILRMAAPPQGSATLAATPYLAGAGAQVRDLAAGPVGSIWFSRYTDPTAAAPAPDGQVGYVDQATGAVQAFPTGAASAPTDLVAGPDGRMWFVDAGAAPGIGYVDTAGHGALLRFGSAVPTSLTFAQDGTLWFTDATHNTISRVVTSALPTATQVVATGRSGKVTRTARARGGKVRLSVTCAPSAVGACTGTLRLRTNARLHRPGKAERGRITLTRKVPYAVAPGAVGAVTLPLTAAGRAVVRRGRLGVRVEDAGAVLSKLRLRR